MVEFRLYYDDTGKVICYTCDNLPGDNYILVDPQTYAEGRTDLRIVDKEIKRSNEFIFISKLVESLDGIKCNSEDVCVIDNSDDSKTWKLEVNEYRQN